ncbi:PspC domain-containing protein [Angustibacter luteus]|uniref:PspC domain-containing protein n=1 Tax=Angustibacter luteus TaxID=658456 RepID=A0ABW1JFP2_9ACTN
MTQNLTENLTENPTDATQPKRLVRPRDGRKLGGVCAGVADYTGVDVTVVRLVAVASVLFGFAGVVLYVAGVILMPQE